jgi:tight adherence protein C
MTLVAILGLLLVAVAVAFSFVAVFEPRVRRSEKLGLIDVYGYAIPAEPDGATSTRRTLDAIASAVGEVVGSRLGGLREEEVQRRLIAAGFYKLGARRFLGYRVLFTIGLTLLVIWLLLLAGVSGGGVAVLALVAVGVGWLAPNIYLARRMRSRLDSVDYSMPELIDLLVVILEAGVAFTGALRIAAERLGGPLGDELRLTIQEQNLGLSTLDALQNWMARCDTPAVATFVRAMVQGERLGISIGQILRNLALEMRKRRRAAAEERAHKAAIKILFPLALLIFPAIFVIVLGPALYRIADTFSGH